MKGVAGVGKVGRIPVSGLVASFDNGDIGSLFGFLEKASTTLTAVGVATVGLLAMSALAADSKHKQLSQVPISRLACIRNFSRHFFGQCIAEDLTFEVEDSVLSVPCHRIRSIRPTLLRRHRYEIELLDDSRYHSTTPRNLSLDFNSFAGIQTVPLYNLESFFIKDHWYSRKRIDHKVTSTGIFITGANLEEVEHMRKHFGSIVEANKESALEEVGRQLEALLPSVLPPPAR